MSTSFKTTLIRLLATIVVRLRRSTIRKADPIFVVVTGSVGKTIMRRALVSAYRTKDVLVHTLGTDYVNEFGVVLSLFGLCEFRFSNLHHWWLLFTRPVYTGYIVIELGADFRTDIQWFLRYFKPQTVVFTYGTNVKWTDNMLEVLASRQHLASFISDASHVTIASYDHVHQMLLAAKGIAFTTVATPLSPYDYPQAVAVMIAGTIDGLQEKLEANRFTRTDTPKLSLIKDEYKVTPLCFDYALDVALIETSVSKILIMSEIRPIPTNLSAVYRPFLPKLKQFETIIFIGDDVVYSYLKTQLSNLQKLSTESIALLQQSMLFSKPDNRVVVLIKLSGKYKHDELYQQVRKQVGQ